MGNYLEALDRANIQLGAKVLDVAVGPGITAVEIARRVGKETVFYGMDISNGMLALTEQRLRTYGFSQFVLKEGNATQSPYPSNTFDVLYNGYMLDLISEGEMPGILAEFKRVLKPGGRMILLNMSKADKDTVLFREKLYQFLVKELVEAGTIKAIIDRRYPLDRIAEAHRYVKLSRRRGMSSPQFGILQVDNLYRCGV